MAFGYGGIVIGVKIEAYFVEDEKEGDINDRVWYRKDEEDNIDKKLNLETDFCCTVNEAHDLTREITEKEIKILHPDSAFNEEYEDGEVVLGVNLSNSYKEQIYDITDLMQKITPEIISQRSKEISDILKKLGLPNEPVRIYMVGNVDT